MHSLFYMASACQPSAMWPRLAHQRHIFRAMALEQHEARGCRLQGVLVAETGSSVVVSWIERGVCKAVLGTGGQAMKAQHMRGLDTGLDTSC